MPMLHAVNDAINAAYRWFDTHRFEFWAGLYIAVFVAPTFIGIFNDIARRDHHDLFMVAWALLFG